MSALVDPVVDGLRLGSLVEIHGVPGPEGQKLEGKLGQLVSFAHGASRVAVTLLDGEEVSLDPKHVRSPEDFKKPGVGGGPSSFDVLLGPRTVDTALAEELAACIFEKGFCVLKLCQSTAGLEDTFAAVRSMGEDGRLGRLPMEVEEGYLGTNGRGKVFWMDAAATEGSYDEVLESNDRTLSYLASLLQPFSTDAAGKYIQERTPALVSLSLVDFEIDDYPEPLADDKTLGDFLGTWRRGAVRAVQFMGPAAAEVLLESREGAAAETLPWYQERILLEAAANTILLFRPACYSYEVRAPGEVLTMMASFLEPGMQFALTGFDGDKRALRGLADGPPQPPGEMVHVMQHHTRLPARWDTGEMYNTGLQAGTDSVVEIPFTRFDLNIYWCPNPEELMSGPPRTIQRHMSFVDGVDLFDYKFFELSKNEAMNMDPLQRHVLEVGANLLNKHGITKKDSNRTSYYAGCAVGVDKDDYPTLPNAGNGTNALAIIANRFSFVFNMKGANYICDTACSASLTATHVAKMMLQNRKTDSLVWHLAIGTHLCLSPAPFIGCSYSQMVSPEGRCFTFNATANGYLRGEGTSGILLKHGADLESQAILRGSALGQDGRSASLTAPNGPAQEEMIWRAVREAQMRPPESTCWECHGTGTSLGDPIEVGAVRRVQIKEPRQEPVMISTAKSNIGHLEGGAAMGGIVKCVLQVMHGQSIPTQHLRQLNPHLEGTVFEAFFSTEVSPFGHDQGHAQVSSLGFGGSNGHGIFWGRKALEGGDITQQVYRRLKMMKHPEVRPIGDDPDDWECDLPDVDARPGEKWTIEFSPDDPMNAPIKWVKDYAPECGGEDEEEDEDVSYSITGTFNSWVAQTMDVGSVPGHHTTKVAVPANGMLEFHFLRDPDKLSICPSIAKCSKKIASVEGPATGLTNTWIINAEPGVEYQIELMMVGKKYSVVWFKA